ncbi:hypothetical protein HF563_12700 [Acidithiobacillus ferridurans]|nr:hypothetical protein [Acidithiobacillus ferridurans]
MNINEHTSGKVKQDEKLGVFKLSMIWAGFPFILAITITGSVFALNSTPYIATLAIILGSIIMFIYVGTLGEIGWKEGRSFAQIAEAVFGRNGYRIIAGLLSVLVLGWFTINTAMPAEIMASSFHLPYWTMSVLLGTLFVLITAYGIKGMDLISNISVPFFVALLFLAFVMVETHQSVGSVDYSSIGDKSMTFSEVLAGVLASFADSGTLAPDFNRWAKDRKTSWISIFAAFPIGFGIAMIAGVVFTVLLADNGFVFDKPFQSSNPIGYMIVAGGGALAFAVLVAAINQGSNATHCLYNSGIGLSKLFGKRYVTTIFVIGILGVIIAATGVWALLIDWLKIIGVLVPPIGAVIIIAYYTGIYSLHSSISNAEDSNKWHKYPWLALTIGWVVGLIVNFTSLAIIIPVPVASFSVSLVIMFMASKAIKKSSLNIISSKELSL